MAAKAGKKIAGHLRFVRMHFQPGIDKRSDQPGPDGALMIGGVAGSRSPSYFGLIVWLARSQRAQSHGREQPLDHVADHRGPAGLIEHGMSAAKWRTIWFGRSDGIVAVVRHRRRRTTNRVLALQNRELNEHRHALPRSAIRRLAATWPSLANQPSSNRSALYQSALISTALPRRGVTTQSPTLASIQVS